MSKSYMLQEIAEIPDVTRRMLELGGEAIRDAAARFRIANPNVIVTVARGSSDHAATYFKYACEMQTGITVASIGPSIASIYKARLKLGNAACIGVSQSGQSPDIVEMVRSAREQGALSIVMTNNPKSPLGAVGDVTIPLCAGPEKSVAATKTFVASIVAELALLAHWSEDAGLITAINRLPDSFDQAIQYDWPQLSDALSDAQSLFVLGRGPSSAIANEAALKFKETCRVQAESYSAAEVLHGPVSIVDPGFPVLAFAARDASEGPVADICDKLEQQGAQVFATTDMVRHAKTLEFAATGHPLTDALALVVSFYVFIEKFSKQRGFDPDKPRYLNKVTQTV